MPVSAPAVPLVQRIIGRIGVSDATACRALAALLIVVGVARILAATQHAGYRNDFAHYYISANILLDGNNPYTTPLKPYCDNLGLEYDKRIPYGSNPPLLIALLTTTAWLPLPVAYGLWAVLQAVFSVGLLEATRRALAWSWRDVRWLLLAGVVLNATCLKRQFYYSQVQVMVAACLAAALILHLQRHRMGSCALAALAAAFKLYPAVLLPWFLLADLDGRRDFIRRGLAAAAVGAAVLAATGIDAWMTFAVDGLSVINRSVGGSLTNYSLPSFTAVMAGEIIGWPLSPNVAIVVKLLGRGLAILAIVAAYRLVWRRQLEPVAEFGIITAAMMAASLVSWTHYFVLMILPIAWLWSQTLAPNWPSGRRLPFVAGFLCLWPELDWVLPVTVGVERLLLHFYPLAALAVVAMLLARSTRDKHDTRLQTAGE
jgi:hypothetical protein